LLLLIYATYRYWRWKENRARRLERRAQNSASNF
jgi:hypothetical protein